MSLTLKVHDKDTRKEISSRSYTKMRLSEEAKGLEYTRQSPGGPGVLTFDLIRDPLKYWEDLETGNIIKLWDGDEIRWEGDIEGVERTIERESRYQVQCLGHCAKLKLNGIPADYDLNLQPGERMSDYIIGKLLADPYLGFTAGEIQTDDFQFETGLDFFPGKSWWDILIDGNKFDGWYFSVEPGGIFNWRKSETAPSYRISLKDCEQSSLNRNRENLWTWVQMGYTPTGSIYDYVTSQSDTAIQRHGMRRKWDSVPGKCSTTEAQQAADVFIELHQKLKPSSSVTADIIRNAQNVMINMNEVKDGKVLQIRDLLTTREIDEDVNVINEICTWEVKELKVSADDNNVSLSPGEKATALDVMLAKIEARTV